MFRKETTLNIMWYEYSRTNISTVNVVIFAGGKFRNCDTKIQDVTRGSIF